MFRRLFRILFGVAVLLLLLAGAAFLLPHQVLRVESGPVQADALVVLGGGSYERPERAAELYRAHAAPWVIVTGAGDGDIARGYLIKGGVPQRVIIMENASRTTRENAEFSVKLLRQLRVRRVILVTSWYHSRRALACFRHFAPDLRFYSRPSYFAYPRADWKREGIARRIRLEYEKLAGYWVRYGIRPF